MRVLVTGGSGFLGHDVVDRLAARGDVAIPFDTAIGPGIAAMAEARPGRVVPVTGDITDLANLVAAFRDHAPDAVVHLAAIVGVPASLGSPSNVVRVNLQGSLNLFEAMRLSGVRRVIHLSTEDVYGDFIADRVAEDAPAKPISPYGVCKLAVEHFGRSYREMHGLDCINLRTSWVYGLRIDRPRPPMNYLNAALEGRALHLAEGGDMVTDYTYVDDLLDGILLALDHAEHPHDTYNLASGEAVSDRALVEHVRALVPGAEISVGPGRRAFAPGMRIPRKGALDSTRARESFGFAPRFPIRDGLAAYIDSWRAARDPAPADA